MTVGSLLRSFRVMGSLSVRTLLGAIMAAAFSRGAAAGDAPPRPNIVLILTDDQRWDAMGCAGHPFLRTPNIDRIAEGGVRFANAFVTTSLCSPSRATFLTGTYAHRHGVAGNESEDPDPSLATFPAILRGHGYETAYIGKWHMRLTAEPRPGFDYWLSFRGQGTYTDPVLNENGRSFQGSGYMTDLLTDYAVAWLERRREAPFCLVLAHKAVHDPFTPAPRHEKELAEAAMEEPASFRDTFEGKPAWLRRGAAYGQKRGQWAASQGLSIPERVEPGVWNPRNPTWLNYFRTLLAVDESVGRVLDTLERSGRLDSTVVVFASDNGYFHGEHGRGDKRLAYEESIRIPLLIRHPRPARAGTVEPRMVLNLDLAPTVLDLAGVPIPAAMQGRSLRPLLEGGEAPWRESFLYEYFREGWVPGIPLTLAVRTERWKYATYPDMDDTDELYDLDADPYELANLVHEPGMAGVLATMRKELDRLLAETGYPKGTAPGAGADVPALREDRPDVLVLEYTWERDRGERVEDGSPFGNHGRMVGDAAVQDGSPTARWFSGDDRVDVRRSDSLDPGLGPWTAEAWVRAEAGGGVVLAQGGEGQGYALTVEGGRPRFYVRGAGIAKFVSGEAGIAGRWVHLAGVIGREANIELYVDGVSAGRVRAAGFVDRNPAEGFTIGHDPGTPVGTYAAAAWFRGLIGPVRVYAGARTAEQIRADAGGGFSSR